MSDYELLYYIYQKDDEALMMLLDKHKKNVQMLTRKIIEQNGYVCHTSDEFDEIVHLGLNELFRAIYNYCDDGRCTFHVFAQKCVEMCVRKYIRHQRSMTTYQFTNAISLDSQVRENDGIYYSDLMHSKDESFQGETILKWYHLDNLFEFLGDKLNEKELIIIKMKIEGYTKKEISQKLMIQPKRVYYVCDKIKKLLLSYID